MHTCLPGRSSSDRQGAPFLFRLAFVFLLAGLLALWPRMPAAGDATAVPWLALEVVGSVVDGDGARPGRASGDSENSACGDDNGLARFDSTTAARAARWFPLGSVLGWHPVPCTLEHARAPPAAV
ncbi:hypothetical protein [Marinobacterium rhizophilum]|uniref:Secreted protein n=1 Tax=Marinobacterium rhizophilum TaxID=420402 RepID=A0ABY5HJV0_9GAMM|nr:hypothetical protein [Marinobacterium rhizophilum]UTW11537.1 hypothetical protein KDW95_20150 [Marinobacterium rhizophilum]